jgi:hypothetical protein
LEIFLGDVNTQIERRPAPTGEIAKNIRRATAQVGDPLIRIRQPVQFRPPQEGQAASDQVPRMVVHSGVGKNAFPFRKHIHLPRNPRKRECGAKQFLAGLVVRAAPFALLRRWARVM